MATGLGVNDWAPRLPTIDTVTSEMVVGDDGLEELIAYCLALKGTRDAAQFRRRFDLMALQRNLKALGTFGYQTMTRRNSVYIQYMPRTLRYARTNLDKYPRFARLRDLLGRHIEEPR